MLIALAMAATTPNGIVAIDNDEVSVLDLTLAPGQSSPATPDDADVVILFLEGGRVRTTAPGKRPRTVARQFGDAVFVPRGSRATDMAMAGATVHEVVVRLKDGIPSPLPNRTGLPLAFPRAGAVKRLDTPRATVWRYSWLPDRATPMHYHDKDVVLAYRYEGTVKSVTPDGKATVTTFKAGDIRFNKANRTHSEMLASARESAVILELK